MVQIMITLQKIRDASPCTDGWKKVLAANGGKNADFGKEFPLSSIIDSNGLDDALWALRCTPELSGLWRKYAVWCARQVEHLMTDPRSRAALDVAWTYSDGLAADEELAAARTAARDAAGDAARTAARDAALAAAWDAARAAAWAAARDAAGDAARDAARDAALAAARTAARTAAGDAAWAAAWAAARDAQSQKLRQILDDGELIN